MGRCRYTPSASGLGWLAMALMVVLAGCGGKKAKYPLCGSDKDCKAGEHCVNKKCQQCATADDCKPGESCKAGACVLEIGACRDDSDCEAGQICRNHRCSSCSRDEDCGPDAHCSNGSCLNRGQCKVDEDCADEEDCVEGTCQVLGRQRPPEVDCELATIYFDYDQSALDESSREALSQSASCIQQAPDRGVFISGHTDPRGTEEYNIALSEKRAQVVADYLARLGIDPARFRVIPKGEIEAFGEDEDGWSKDRRVEFDWQ